MVPAKGVERWLTQRLSHRLGAGARGGDGVCAGVRFLNPRSLVSMLLGRERDDPWDPDRLVWPLLETIDASLDEPWCATLAPHLGHGLEGDDGELRRNRRYSVAHPAGRPLRVVRRPAAEARHRLARGPRHRRRRRSTLDEDLVWQAELWRRLLDRVGEPPPDVRHADTLARLRAGGEGLDLPARLSLFGHTRLPVTEVELLAALGEGRDVHLWLPQPSPRLWDDLAGLGGAGAARRRHVGRAGRPPAARVARAATPASCGGCSTRGHRGDHAAVEPSSRPPTPCSAGCSTTSAPTTPRPSTSAPTAASPTTTAASRCTPATGPPARSTCCARCWSGCSRTTPRSSRATSS